MKKAGLGDAIFSLHRSMRKGHGGGSVRIALRRCPTAPQVKRGAAVVFASRRAGVPPSTGKARGGGSVRIALRRCLTFHG